MSARADHLLAPPLPLDDTRGTFGMLLFIATEALLFLCLFFAYFYLSRTHPRWPMEPPPKLMLASIMLTILVISSLVLYLGEEAIKKGAASTARAAVMATIGLGIVFVVIQVLEYRDHLKTLKPTTNAYGSIFYTITSFHAAHLLLGLCMLAYVLALPSLEPMDRPPHRPLHNAALYWHFVDLIWVIVVAVLYVTPHLVR